MLLIAFGTRPEYIKIKPLLKVFKKNGFNKYKTLFTGQHKEIIGKDIEFDYKIEIQTGSNRLDSIFSSILNREDFFEGITHVMIQGDTASAYAVSLAAFHRNVPVIHLEAGLRTYDIQNPYPEEYYRRCISNLASINLCVSEFNKENLAIEKTPGNSFVVGNTVLDNLRDIQIKYTNKVLVTLHRRENHDLIEEWFKEIDSIAATYPGYEFILPIHPNPNVKKHSGMLKNVKVIEPLEHIDLVNLLAECAYVITDSGGIQEESAFLKKKSIVCRKSTERIEGLNIFSFLCPEPSRLKYMVESVILSEKINYACPYGDGFSSEKIYEIIRTII